VALSVIATLATFATDGRFLRMGRSWLPWLLFSRFSIIPLFVVWIAGVIAAVRRLQTHRRASQMLLSGLVGFALTMVAEILMGFAMQSAFMDSMFGAPGYFIWLLFRSVLQAGCFALLIAAVFVDRDKQGDK
jgi:hypothetical protein